MSVAQHLMRTLVRTVLFWTGMLATFLPGCGGDSVTPAPTVTIEVSPASISAGQTATLTWSSINASTCSASGAWTGAQSTSGSVAVSQAQPGTYTYTLGCSSSTSNALPGSATLTVTPSVTQLSILTGTLSNGVIATSYNQTIQSTGGVSPFTWTLSSGALPHGLSLSTSTTNTVTISGTPDTVAQGVPFTIQVTDSAHHVAAQPYTVSIMLQADSLVLSPASLDFGNEVVGSASGALAETLINTATSALVITSIATTGSNNTEFNQTSTTCGTTLAAGASCAIHVSFAPGQTGPRTAALTISVDTAGSPQLVSLSGVGLTAGPNATLSAVDLPFGTQLVGTTSPARSVALNNYGTLALNIGSIAASTSFAETNHCIPSLASGATCEISVTFTPGASGDMTGTLSISDDAAGSPQKVALSGNGSTMTPLLTGYCVTSCGTKQDLSQCPVGQPSETPALVDMGRLCGVGPEVSATVDLARSCVVINHRILRGECEAQ